MSERTTYNVLVLGVTGKLGREVVDVLIRDPKYNILPITVAESEEKACVISGKEFQIYPFYEKESVKGEMFINQLYGLKKSLDPIYVIDCTSLLQWKTAQVFATPPLSFPVIVLGTEGKDDPENEKALRKMAADYGPDCLVARCSNCAEGLNGLTRALKGLSDFCDGAEAYITEEHHKGKKDKPSGYAKTIKTVLEEMGCKVRRVRSIRKKESCPATHRVLIKKDGQEFGFKTKVLSRRAYAQGLARTFLPRLIAIKNSSSNSPSDFLPFGLYNW